jgi:hypothetical protein
MGCHGIFLSLGCIKNKIYSIIYILLLSFFRGIWYLVPLSAIYQIYCGRQFLCWREPEYLEKTTDLPQVNEKYKCSLEYTLPWARFELTTLVIAEIVVNSTTVPLFDLKSVPTSLSSNITQLSVSILF